MRPSSTIPGLALLALTQYALGLALPTPPSTLASRALATAIAPPSSHLTQRADNGYLEKLKTEVDWEEGELEDLEERMNELEEEIKAAKVEKGDFEEGEPEEGDSGIKTPTKISSPTGDFYNLETLIKEKKKTQEEIDKLYTELQVKDKLIKEADLEKKLHKQELRDPFQVENQGSRLHIA